MQQRHTQLRKDVKKLQKVKIDAVLLRPAAQRKVDVLIGKLAELDKVTKNLQHFVGTIRSARAYFDIFLEYFSDLSERLDPRVRTLHHPFFESGKLKVQDGQEEALITVKKSELGELLLA